MWPSRGVRYRDCLWVGSLVGVGSFIGAFWVSRADLVKVIFLGAVFIFSSSGKSYERSIL